MSSLLKLAGDSRSQAKIYVDDVFSAFNYAGNSASRNIVNGVDLSQGGMVWTKMRTLASSHYLIDTVRGASQALKANSQVGQASITTDFSGFNANGYSLGVPASTVEFNKAGYDYVSYSFKKSPKFFDVVSFTLGNNADRRINHNLGVPPGLIVLKVTSSGGNWCVYHRSLATPQSSFLFLNTTDQPTNAANFWGSAPTASDFGINEPSLGGNGYSVIGYVFAHDATTDGLIKCDSVTLDGGGSGTINLGWEPQFILYKNLASGADWMIEDVARSLNAVRPGNVIKPNLTDVEGVGSGLLKVTPTGFTIAGGVGNATYVFMAIRRSNKPPTLANQVFKPVLRTGTGAVDALTGIGFAPDIVAGKVRYPSNNIGFIYDRQRGRNSDLKFAASDLENTSASNSQDLVSFDSDGISLGVNNNTLMNASGTNTALWLFRRAAKFLDIVAYTGSGNNNPKSHGLGVKPELMLIKCRAGGTASWYVYHASLGASKFLMLDSANSVGNSPNAFASNEPTDTQFTVLGHTTVNGPGYDYMAYLFASLPGISKIGSYTGNGTSQTIDCGFAAGARFGLIKRTDAAGDWYVFDSARGVVTGNEPVFKLNGSSAELTMENIVDPVASGFIVNQSTATNVNVTGANYIYFAIA